MISTAPHSSISFSPVIPTRSPAPRHKEVTPMFSTTLERPRAVELYDELPCRVSDPELFFAESPRDVETAKAMCLDCPLRQTCLDGALERREPWGVWGGELFVSGVVVARKRPRGRPRKDAAVA
jgi:WhiB family redox-sensing transcriptional regulator